MRHLPPVRFVRLTGIAAYFLLRFGQYATSVVLDKIFFHLSLKNLLLHLSIRASLNT
jgi:hypothetical protein